MTKRRTGCLSKRGRTFYCTWRVNGRAISKALYDKDGHPITTLREAEVARAALMSSFTVSDEATSLESISAKLEGKKAELFRLENEQNPPLKITSAWDAYLSNPNRPDSGPQTLRQYENHFDQFCAWLKERLPTLLALREINSKIAEEYATYLTQRELSANSFNKHICFLKLFFRVLKDNARLSNNPYESIRRKRQIPISRRELIIDELKKVCSTATGEMRLLFAIGIYTGLRLGDCATLRWAEVDLRRKRISRIPNKTARRNPKPVHVPIHPVLHGMLDEIPIESRKEYIMPATAADYLRDSNIVTDRIQKHFLHNGIRVHKLDTGRGTQKRAVVEVGFHSFRHTFVSMCREANTPLSVVEAIVGHSNPAMTRHYTHVSEVAAASAVNGLPVVVGDAPVAQLPAARTNNLEQIRAIVDKMNTSNWSSLRDELLAMLPLPLPQAS